jgi:hypothetical protein
VATEMPSKVQPVEPKKENRSLDRSRFVGDLDLPEC